MKEKIILTFDEIPNKFVIGSPKFFRGADDSEWVEKPDSWKDLPPIIYIPNHLPVKSANHFDKVIVKLSDSELKPKTTLSDHQQLDTVESRIKLIDTLVHPNFHYSDSDMIQSSYNNWFKEQVIVELFSQAVEENAPDISDKLWDIFNGEKEQNEIIQWVKSNQIPGIGVEEMFVRYLKEITAAKKINIGIDILDQTKIDKLLHNWEKNVENISKIFTLQSEEVQIQRAKVRRKAVETIISDLRKVQGEAIFMRGEFNLKQEGSQYLLDHRHPISDYYGEEIIISLLGIETDHFDSVYRREYSKFIDEIIVLTVFGYVFQPLNTDKARKEVTIYPVAIF